jgi:hypothetical protein
MLVPPIGGSLAFSIEARASSSRSRKFGVICGLTRGDQLLGQLFCRNLWLRLTLHSKLGKYIYLT